MTPDVLEELQRLHAAHQRMSATLDNLLLVLFSLCARVKTLEDERRTPTRRTTAPTKVLS